jgi:BMFP domain-containing protein YqiC
VPQAQAQLDIGPPGQVGVGRGGLADRAEVEDRFERRFGGQERVQRLGGDDSRRRVGREVAPLAGAAEPVTTVSSPRRVKAACRLDPMKPAPPVTMIMGRAYTGAGAPAKADPIPSSWSGPMSDRPRFFDDLAGVAGGAISALAGLREEAEAMVRARTDEAIRRLDLVKREELEAVSEMAANARAGQEAAEVKLAAVTARLDALEARLAASLAPKPATEPPAASQIGDDAVA